MIEEANGSGIVQRDYVWMDDMPVALVDYTGSSPVIYYIHTDHLNRPQKMTDASTAVAWDGVFDPFGKVSSVTGSATNLLMFPGQFYDSETQLSQNWFRDYDPTIGRYVQSDPIGLRGGINTYAYVGGNPMIRTDRNGKIWWWAVGAATGAGADLAYQLWNNGGNIHCVDWRQVASFGLLGLNFGALADVAIASMAAEGGEALSATTESAFSHSYSYDARVLDRALEDPVSHNFPYSFDDEVLSTNPISKPNGYNIYQQPGSMNGTSGNFEIGVNNNGVIDHRFFRPGP